MTMFTFYPLVEVNCPQLTTQESDYNFIEITHSILF
jgi:hypothetical protein